MITMTRQLVSWLERSVVPKTRRYAALTWTRLTQYLHACLITQSIQNGLTFDPSRKSGKFHQK